MIRMLRLFLPLAIMTALGSCQTASEFPKNDHQDQIHFGQGGGFSGAVNYFILHEDGRLFQRGKLDTTVTFISTWPSSLTKQMFASYKSLQLDTLHLYEPGDLYYFIEYRAKADAPHRIAWGRGGVPVPDNLIRYYNLLYKSTKSKS